MNSNGRNLCAVSRVEEAVRSLADSVPALSTLVKAFQELLIEEERFKTSLGPNSVTCESSLDGEKLLKGIPLASPKSVKMGEADLKRAARSLIPAIKAGFPHLGSQLDCLAQYLEHEPGKGRILAHAVLGQITDSVEAAANDLGIEPDVLIFVMQRLIKPFAEHWGQGMGACLSGALWTKGYCPICGSWPNLSFLEPPSGRRILRCSFCGHHWHFMLTVCQFCENSDSSKLEFIFSENHPSDGAALCLQCNRYILRKDLRECVHDIHPEVVALELSYLDVLAQERGFVPGGLDVSPRNLKHVLGSNA